MTILVTGATGRVGGQVAAQLLTAGHDVRVLARTPSDVDLEGADVVEGDFRRPETVAAAARGAESVFLLWSTGTDDTAAEVVDSLADQVGRIVYLSATGIPEDPGAELPPILDSHRRLEALVGGSGGDWSVVRGGGFAANTLGWAAEIRAEGVVREPFGGIPRPLVHERDLAAVAVIALTTEVLLGERPQITGPAAVSGQQQVDAIAEAIGRPLRLEALDREASIERMTRATGDRATAESMVETWAGMLSDPEPVSPDFEDITGHPATSYATWAVDHAADFAP